MQISLLAIIQILGVTHCQETDTSASEIVAKFRDLLYDETTLSPDYEDPSSSSSYEDSTDPVTTPITTPPPAPASSTSPASTTEADLEDVNLSEDDLEINNEVQTALEPRQLDLDIEDTVAQANRVTFPETETIEVISNPLPDISALIPDILEEVAESTEEAVMAILDEVSPALDNIGNSETGQITYDIADSGDSETGQKPISSGKWFYYSGHPGLLPHYWPRIQSLAGESEEINEVEDRVKVMAHYPYHYPYYHPRQYSGYHHPYVYFYRSSAGQV